MCWNRNFTLNWGIGIAILCYPGVLESSKLNLGFVGISSYQEPMGSWFLLNPSPVGICKKFTVHHWVRKILERPISLAAGCTLHGPLRPVWVFELFFFSFNVFVVASPDKAVVK